LETSDASVTRELSLVFCTSPHSGNTPDAGTAERPVNLGRTHREEAATMTDNHFMRACHCSLEQVEDLLASNPGYFGARGADGETPLGAAAHSNQPEIVRFLLSRGMAPDIYAEIILGRVEQVQTMLQADPGLAHARAAGAHQYPPLYFAAISGQEAVAEVLLAHGADLHAEEQGITPLHGAAAFGQEGMLQWLLARGASVDALSPFGATPLHLAADGGHPGAVAALITHGANPHATTRDGETPREKARQRGHYGVADLLP
jgi:ankyrin repeat protein